MVKFIAFMALILFDTIQYYFRVPILILIMGSTVVDQFGFIHTFKVLGFNAK